MLLTISTTNWSGHPATDLGYLLVKHPERIRSVDATFGKAHCFFPEASEDRCTAAVVLEIDPVKLVRRGKAETIFDYVSDRPYVSSSFMCVAISTLFGTSMQGVCKDKPELLDDPLPLEAKVFSVPVKARRDREDLLRKLFEPLGYVVEVENLPLNQNFPEWGTSHYFNITLRGNVRVKDLLNHLYVLIPVLEGEKHYAVREFEVDKLERHGAGWLDSHPMREAIMARYLEYKRNLVNDAQNRIPEAPTPDEDGVEAEEGDGVDAEREIERTLPLWKSRILAVKDILAKEKVTSAVELGCGDGKVLASVASEKSSEKKIEKLAGMDVSMRSLRIASDRLRRAGRLDVPLYHGALTYRDERLEGFDAVILMEVIEHLEPHRLDAAMQVVFGEIRPRIAVLSTPNRAYNVRFKFPLHNGLRHRDHRFEFTTKEFILWCGEVAKKFGYDVSVGPVGDEDPEVGPPSLIATFRLDPKKDPLCLI